MLYNLKYREMQRQKHGPLATWIRESSAVTETASLTVTSINQSICRVIRTIRQINCTVTINEANKYRVIKASKNCRKTCWSWEEGSRRENSHNFMISGQVSLVAWGRWRTWLWPSRLSLPYKDSYRVCIPTDLIFSTASSWSQGGAIRPKNRRGHWFYCILRFLMKPKWFHKLHTPIPDETNVVSKIQRFYSV